MEIDDIFAKRPIASTSTLPPQKTTFSKKKKEKTKEKQAPESTPAASSSKKRPAPETIIDPSTRPPPPKKTKVDKPIPADKDDTERFKDSRGSGPRLSLFFLFPLHLDRPFPRTENRGGVFDIQRGRAGYWRRGRANRFMSLRLPVL